MTSQILVKEPSFSRLKTFWKSLYVRVKCFRRDTAFNEIILEKGLLNGKCMTVTGKTLEDNLKDIEPYKDNKIIKSFDSPIKSDSHLRILYGNLAKMGLLQKLQAKKVHLLKAKPKYLIQKKRELKPF